MISRKSFPAICIILLVHLLCSCGKGNCVQPPIGALAIINSDSTGDTLIIISEYVSNTNTIKVVDTEHVSSQANYPATNVYFNFKPGYDYTINILPAGALYKIKDIYIGNNQIQYSGSGSSSEVCEDSYKYTINDSVVVVPMITGSTNTGRYIYLKY